jgi:hypothetical protein
MPNDKKPADALKGIVGLAGAAVVFLWWNGNLKPAQPPAPISAPGVVKAAIPEVVNAAIPETEARFADIIRQYVAAYNAAPNQMAQGALRPQRATELCKLPLAKVTDWVGRVTTLSSANDGRGVLKVRLSVTTSVGTTNNGLSDQLSNLQTLMAVNSPVHLAAQRLQVGQLVIFSGRFAKESIDCIEEKSLTVAGAMQDPTFLFQFSDVRPTQ